MADGEREDADGIDAAQRALERAKEDIAWAEEALERARRTGAHPDARPAGLKAPSPAAASAPAAPSPPAASAPAQAPPAPRPAPAAPAPQSARASPKGWRVEFERDNCIGAGACVAANADFWSIDHDGKATLKGAVYDAARKVWVLEITDDAQLRKQRDAAGVCPVNVIHIYSPDGKQEI